MRALDIIAQVARAEREMTGKTVRQQAVEFCIFLLASAGLSASAVALGVMMWGVQ
jgi:hypothetical protein